MITLNLEWREALWYLQGGMAGSHARWGVYQDMVDHVWPQCSEQERRNIFLIMRRDLGYLWRPDEWNGHAHMTDQGEGPWRDEADITDLTPWMYFRQVLARFDPDRQYAVTLRADSRKLADRVYKDARQRGILIPRDEDYGWRNPKSRTVTVRAYEWRGDYRIDWDKRCDPDRIVSVEKMEIPDDGTM